MKYEGGNWIDVGGASFSTGEAEFTSLNVYNGIPYVAYVDGDNAYKTTVMKFDYAPTITEMLTVSSPTTTGAAITLNPTLTGLTVGDFTLLDSLNQPITITNATTSDAGATYVINAALSSGQTYTITANKNGYSFGSPQNVVVP
jgi:hypothetical protein